MIGTIILAAGESTRMGRSKLNLPLKDGRPIILHVVELFRSGGAQPIVVVTGGDRRAIEKALVDTEVGLIHNPDFASGEMISSVKVGLHALEETSVQAALILPGDLPLLQPSTIEALLAAWRETYAPIIVPSYQHRRGHPLLLARSEWDAIQDLAPSQTLRDYMSRQEARIFYVETEDPGILQDMDTPEDYQRVLEQD
jgi:molybdenum cofactor cytidylyltransferase